MLESPWMKIIGEDYVTTAFQFAHEADPDAQLYYNDYGLECESKRTGAIALVRKLQASGIPITAIGLQEHNTLKKQNKLKSYENPDTTSHSSKRRGRF